MIALQSAMGRGGGARGERMASLLEVGNGFNPELTDVLMLPKISFGENEPVVCRTKAALDCFLQTPLDVLILGNSMASSSD